MNNKLYKYSILTLSFLLFGCLPSSPPPPYKDYIVITALSHLGNNDQKLLSMNFVYSLNKKLKLADATYSYLYLCNDLKHLGNVVKNKKVKSVSPENLNDELQKIDSPCTAKIEKLDEIIQNIGDQDTNKKMVVFIQIPWSKIDSKTHKILKTKFSNIKNKRNILKIYGFGGQGDLPQITDIFHGVPVHPFVGIDIEQTTILPIEAKKVIDQDLASSKKN